MTNLLIAYPDIPFRAIAISATSFTDPIREARNTIGGERYQDAYMPVASGGFNVDYDMGAGLTATADYIIIARADMLINKDRFTIGQNSAGIGSAYTLIQTTSTFKSELVGPRSQDYYAPVTSNTKRSFRVSLDTPALSGSTCAVSKIYLGQMLDMGRDPDYEIDLTPPNSFGQYSSGGLTAIRTAEPVYRFSFTWTGVTDAAVTAFQEKIVMQSEVYNHRFFLVTTGNHSILNEFRVVHVRLVDSSVTKEGGIADWNNVTASFEEVLG